ncbi:hypothetical protein AMATHDRAFT_44132 [Amanita thiersii Skay4041]|uniref:Uncharacterized protein n=1 Tax=Amanita thiersii Skay4041 TaxID=703135 RepID=A0A2A9N8K6_9AGAR|nr:hypothetical protein AMATHDRAFT_44132 [Amanita thiersii Skay4041]
MTPTSYSIARMPLSLFRAPWLTGLRKLYRVSPGRTTYLHTTLSELIISVFSIALSTSNIMLIQLNKNTTTLKQGLNSSTAKKPLTGTSSNKENVGKKPLSQAAGIRRTQLKKPPASSSKAGTSIRSVNKPTQQTVSDARRQALTELPIFTIKKSKLPVKGSRISTSSIPCDKDWAAGLDEASVSTPLKKRSPVSHERRPFTPYPQKVSSIPQGSVADDTLDLSDYLNKHTAENILDTKPEFRCSDISLPESTSPSFAIFLVLVSNEDFPVPIVPRSNGGTKLPFPCPGFPLPERTYPLFTFTRLSVKSNKSEVPTVSGASRAPVGPADTTGDSTVDIERELNKFYAKHGDACNLMDISLGSLDDVKIDYSFEFPTGAIGRAPHILVAQYKCAQKRKQQAAQNMKSDKRKEGETHKSSKPKSARQDADCERKQPTRSKDDAPSPGSGTLDQMLQDGWILDLPIHVFAPAFNWPVMEPEQYIARTSPSQESSPVIPSLIVTSPSDGDLVLPPSIENCVHEFDYQDILDGSYKGSLLDASLHNWTLRFQSSASESHPEAVPEIASTVTADIPEVIVTSPSDGDLISYVAEGEINLDFEDIVNKAYKNYLLDGSLHNWNMRFKFSMDEDVESSDTESTVALTPLQEGKCYWMLKISRDIVNKAYKNYLSDGSLHNWNTRFKFSAMISMDEDVESTDTESTESLETLARG